jgi:hypothetical protein
MIDHVISRCVQFAFNVLPIVDHRSAFSSFFITWYDVFQLFCREIVHKHQRRYAIVYGHSKNYFQLLMVEKCCHDWSIIVSNTLKANCTHLLITSVLCDKQEGAMGLFVIPRNPHQLVKKNRIWIINWSVNKIWKFMKFLKFWKRLQILKSY